MKILIIGKDGQLGQELMREAGEKKIKAIGVSHAELDICDAAESERVIIEARPNFVINTAAFHVVSECEKNPSKARAVNAAAVGTLAEICKKIGARFVTFSTDYVFDGLKGAPYVEEDEPHPAQVYGASKLEGEKLALQKNAGSLVVRTCGVYGGIEGSRSKKGNFVRAVLRAAEAGEKSLEVSSEQIVNPTFAGHLADALLELLSKNPAGGIYHLAAEGYCSWADFAREVVRLKKLPLEIISVNRGGLDAAGFHRPLFSALANTKAKKLGIKLPHWKQGLLSYFR